MTRRRKLPPNLIFSGRNLSKREMILSMLCGPKYIKMTDAEAAADAAPDRTELSPGDAKKLAALVRQYGWDKIAKAARSIVTRAPGRPSRGLLPYYERMHEVDWLEDVAEERHKAESHKPYTDAATELYEMKFGTPRRDKDGKLRYLMGCIDGSPLYGKAPELASFLNTIKKKRQRGRRELQAAREALARAGTVPEKAESDIQRAQINSP
jgi:hypothetical protein